MNVTSRDIINWFVLQEFASFPVTPKKNSDDVCSYDAEFCPVNKTFNSK